MITGSVRKRSATTFIQMHQKNIPAHVRVSARVAGFFSSVARQFFTARKLRNPRKRSPCGSGSARILHARSEAAARARSKAHPAVGNTILRIAECSSCEFVLTAVSDAERAAGWGASRAAAVYIASARARADHPQGGINAGRESAAMVNGILIERIRKRPHVRTPRSIARRGELFAWINRNDHNAG